MQIALKVSIITVVFGLFGLFVKPVILKRFLGRRAPEHIKRETRMARMSGLILVILGLMLLFDLWTRSV